MAARSAKRYHREASAARAAATEVSETVVEGGSGGPLFRATVADKAAHFFVWEEIMQDAMREIGSGGSEPGSALG
jgi:hypothetical protein